MSHLRQPNSVRSSGHRRRTHGPGPTDTTCKSPPSFTVWGENAGWPLVPMPSPTRSKALPPARRIKPRRATRSQERELQERRMDGAGDRGAKMAAFAGPSFCEKGPRLMSKKPSRTVTPATAGNVPAPVRVRLKRINSDYARPYPPDGQAREWWHRLKNAFGTASSAFVDASLHQLIAAARRTYRHDLQISTELHGVGRKRGLAARANAQPYAVEGAAACTAD